MGLTLKIAAGIVLGFLILWAVEIGLVVSLFAAISSSIPSMAPKAQNVTPRPAQATFSQYKPQKRKVARYKTVWIPGKPLEKCLGKDKELNENVLRCRHGYKKKVKYYKWVY